MATQGVTINVQDGGLALAPPGLGNVLYVIGCTSKGTTLQPFQSANPAAIVSQFGFGPASELACNIVNATGNPVVVCSVPQTTPGVNSAINDGPTNKGTSAVTVTGNPQDTYYALVSVVTGGTIGVAGCVVNVSLDAGRTTFCTINLGTASSALIQSPSAGGSAPVQTGLTLNFAAGTLVAGDTYQWISDEPQWTDANVAAATSPLIAWSQSSPKDVIVVGGASRRNGAGTVGSKGADATAFDGYMTALLAKYRFMRRLCSAGDATAGGASSETEAQWITSLTSDFINVSSTRVGVTAGHYNCVSAISQTQFRRPLLWFAAARDSAVAIQVDLGRVKDGPLGNMIIPSIPDGYLYHDENLTPGLDGAHFISAWSIAQRPGLYIKNPNLMCPPGSDFKWLQYGAVIDVASQLMYLYWSGQLSAGVRVYAAGSANAGQILQQDQAALLNPAQALLTNGLVNPGAVSAALVTIPPGQNVLSTAQLNVSCAITPLGYLKAIVVNLLFVNPAIVQVTSP